MEVTLKLSDLEFNSVKIYNISYIPLKIWKPNFQLPKL